jgi:hypothetical protein
MVQTPSVRDGSRGAGGQRVTLACLAAVVVIWLGCLLGMDRHGVWTVDDALKTIQAEGVLRSSFRDFSLPNGNRGLDPGMRLSPVPPPFARLHEGRLYPVFSPAFAAAGALAARCTGPAGLLLLPLAGGVLILLGLVQLVRGAGLGESPARGTVLCVGLTTPVWFYSLVYWEHSIATALCVWATVLCLRFLRTGQLRSLGAGAFLAGAAIWFRDDLYVFALVLLTLLAWQIRDQGRGRIIRCGLLGSAGLLAGLIPLWVLQQMTVGRPLGWHLSTHLLRTADLLGHLQQRPAVAYNLLLSVQPSVAVSLLLSLPLVAAFLFGWKVPIRKTPLLGPALGVFALIGTGVALARLLGPGGALPALDRANSLFIGAPLLASAFLRREGETAEERFICKLVLGHVLLYVLAAPELGSRGIHWGNRLLLPVYALLAVPAVANLNAWWRRRWVRRSHDPAVDGRKDATPRLASASAGRRRTSICRTTVFIRVALSLILAVGFGAQLYSIRLLARMKAHTSRIDREIAARPERIILTDTFWVPPFLATSFGRKAIFLARNQPDYQTFLELMKRGGETEFLYLTPRQDPAGFSWDISIVDRELSFFALRGSVQRISPAASGASP